MPELPEVETVVRGLAAGVVGRRFESVWIGNGDKFRPSPEALAAGLTGRTATRAWRVGKFLFLDLDDGQTLAGHLRMTGQFLLVSPATPVEPHTHLTAALSDGLELRWRDVRRFGWLELVERADTDRLLAGLGPDALVVDAAEFARRLAGSGRALKALLLDQSCVAGVGNIYADEILFRAGIRPLQVPRALTAKRVRRLHEVMQTVLHEAIAANGSSFDSNYRAVNGESGAFQDAHFVYGRAGLPCKVCGRAIERILVAQRSSCFCGRCQR